MKNFDKLPKLASQYCAVKMNLDFQYSSSENSVQSTKKEQSDYLYYKNLKNRISLVGHTCQG